MIVDCVSPSKEKEASKKAALSPPSCCNTRSKLKSTSESVQDILTAVTNEDAADKQQQQLKLATCTRTSSRTSKKPCREASPVISPNVAGKKSNQNNSKSSIIVPEQVKTRRSWELWSVEDKNAFFDALCEFGKDFESVQHYIAQKNKKKNHLPHMIKNKDQVRHFYYRTWHKISKYLDIAQDIKKQTQELYGLINYGELRKKLGGRMDHKNGQKLNELVHNGATTIRFKGKNLRVKTPLCRALKRLNAVDDPKDDDQPKLPPKVTIEFRPYDTNSWSRVQAMAQNPRLRMLVSLQRRLCTVIEYLQSKWRSQRLKTKEQLESTLGESHDFDKEAAEYIRVLPCKESEISLVTVKECSETATSASVSLQNYRERILPKESEIIARKNTKNKTRPVEESVKRIIIDEDAEMEWRSPDKSSNDGVKADTVNNDAHKFEDLGSPEMPDQEFALKKLLEFTTVANEKEKAKDDCFGAKDVDIVDTYADITDKVVDMPEKRAEIEKTAEDCETLQNESDKVEKIRKGWTLQECAGLTVGEVFLMLGSPNKLVLEYKWEKKLDDKIKDGQSSKSSSQSENILRRLLQLASTTFTDLSNRTKQNADMCTCRCGHVCSLAGGFSTKTNLCRSPAANRGTKTNKLCTTITPVSGNTTAINSSNDNAQFLVPRMVAPQSKTQGNKSYASMVQQNKITDNAFKEQLDKLMPSHRKARGRIRKSVVVQRELLPKTSASHSMMTLRIVPTTSQLSGSFVPVLQPTVTVTANPLTIPKGVKYAPTSRASIPTTTVSAASPIQVPAQSTIGIPVTQTPLTGVPDLNLAAAHTTSEKCSSKSAPATSVLELSIPEQTPAAAAAAGVFTASPPSISLLDLPSCEALQTENTGLSLDSTEKLLDISLANSTSSFSAFNLASATDEAKSVGSLSNIGVDPVPDSSVVQSQAASSPFKNLDSSWFNGEAIGETGDMSLSSLLGQLESPLKTPITQGFTIISEDPTCGRLASDVDSQVLCMLNENSVDYVAKFADLAAQIAVSESPKKQTQ